MSKKIELNIPTKWSDITLGQYIQLRPVLKSETSDVKRVINILSVLTKEKTDVIKGITIPDYHKILKKLKFLNDPLPTTLENEVFKIGDSLYTFRINSKNLLFGEYINVMEIMANAKNNEDVMYDNLHKIFTIICRPVKKTIFGYKEKKIDSESIRANAQNFFDNMSITIAYPIAVFFYAHYPILTKAIKISLMQTVGKTMKEAEMTLGIDGAGGE